jgi:hypothetical protein
MGKYILRGGTVIKTFSTGEYRYSFRKLKFIKVASHANVKAKEGVQ